MADNPLRTARATLERRLAALLLARQGRVGRGQAISPAQADDAVRKWQTARNEKLIPST
jgi:hypothetical protein